MTASLTVFIDEQPITVPAGITVAAALALSGREVLRHSVSGQPRTVFCGMGICQECRVMIDGRRRPACQTLCRENMRIERLQ